MDALNRSYPGIAPDDPLKPLLDSMAERDEAMNANAAALAEAIKGVTVLPPEALARLEKAAASGAARSAAILARAYSRRTMALYGCGLVGALLLGAGSGWLLGRSSYVASEQRLAAALDDGPSAAGAWAALIQQNDINRALAQCTGTRAYADATGRKACAVPLWIEARKTVPPM